VLIKIPQQFKIMKLPVFLRVRYKFIGSIQFGVNGVS